jgi:fatty acid synthase subunit alpha, fungi type
MNHLYELCLRSQSVNPLFVDRSIDLAPITMIDAKGSIKFSEISRLAKHKSLPCGRPLLRELRFPVQVFDKGKLTHSEELTQTFFNDLNIARRMGFSFQGKNVLITGAGRNSIGINILKNLLSGGARVLLTTSSYRPETTQMYQEIYARYGARNSVLRVLPFNQGSYQDVQALARYIEEDSGWDLDFIVPFAAVSEIGRELDDIDSKSELAHRLMLTNLLRLLGAVARGKREKQVISRPAQVILPLSPNHGLMGNDGLYSESKRALETLFSKWTSETWHDYLSLCGVNIGWTRGTGLMNDNDIVSQGVEALGVHTFSSTQMAAYIVCLMGGKMRTACQTVPLVADFGGGLGAVEDFKHHVGKIRRDLYAQSDIQRAIHHEDALQDAAVNKRLASPSPKLLTPRANVRLPLPELPDYDNVLSPLTDHLGGMVDLSRVVVVTGFAEIGPHGNSRTRWEMEAYGDLSLEGSIEMAWIMGLIKHHQGPLKNRPEYSGWVDPQSLEPVEDVDVKARYMHTILKHSGIRLIEPEICDNSYDPERKLVMQEVVIQKDLAPFEATPEVARDFQNQHGDRVRVTKMKSGSYIVQLLAGATVWLGKFLRDGQPSATELQTRSLSRLIRSRYFR